MNRQGPKSLLYQNLADHDNSQCRSVWSRSCRNGTLYCIRTYLEQLSKSSPLRALVTSCTLNGLVGFLVSSDTTAKKMYNNGGT